MQLRDVPLNLLLLGASIGPYTPIPAGWCHSVPPAKQKAMLLSTMRSMQHQFEYGVHTLEWETNPSWRNKDGTLSCLSPRQERQDMVQCVSQYPYQHILYTLLYYNYRPIFSSQTIVAQRSSKIGHCRQISWAANQRPIPGAQSHVFFVPNPASSQENDELTKARFH